MPADAVVIGAHDLDVDEAPLTGESLAVRRDVDDELEQAVLLAGGLLAGAVWLRPLESLLRTQSLSLATPAVALVAAAVPGLLLGLWLRGTARRAI